MVSGPVAPFGLTGLLAPLTKNLPRRPRTSKIGPRNCSKTRLPGSWPPAEIISTGAAFPRRTVSLAACRRATCSGSCAAAVRARKAEDAAGVGPGDLRLGDPGHGLNCGEVLGPEPRFGAPGPDAFDPDRRPR